MVLAAVHLLARHPQPSEEQIREGLAGNLCRCTGYVKIFEAVVAACQRSGIRNSIPKLRDEKRKCVTGDQ